MPRKSSATLVLKRGESGCTIYPGEPNAAPIEVAGFPIEVFNVLGRRVAVLKDEVMAAGYYSVPWEGRSENASPLPSGVYFYRLRSADVTLTRRMLLLK